MESKINGKILIVDDEKVNCNVLIALLEGYQTVVAKNGEQALKRALTEPQPDLILLDVVMPELDGYEVCECLKRDPKTKNIPVIFITVKGTEEEEARGLKLGAVDYISKPFSPAIVHARVANHMELKRQRDLLEQLYVTDDLTQIANRRRFETYLATHWQVASRMQGEISLIMIDIDHFKKYNDGYGHVKGDDCLKQVAQILNDNCPREIDLVARYGGEEFVVVLPGTDSDGAKLIAIRLCETVFKQKLPHQFSNTEAFITISVGVGSVQPSVNCEKTELVNQADEALYRAKQAGRNRVSN